MPYREDSTHCVMRALYKPLNRIAAGHFELICANPHPHRDLHSKAVLVNLRWKKYIKSGETYTFTEDGRWVRHKRLVQWPKNCNTVASVNRWVPYYDEGANSRRIAISLPARYTLVVSRREVDLEKIYPEFFDENKRCERVDHLLEGLPANIVRREHAEPSRREDRHTSKLSNAPSTGQVAQPNMTYHVQHSSQASTPRKYSSPSTTQIHSPVNHIESPIQSDARSPFSPTQFSPTDWSAQPTRPGSVPISPSGAPVSGGYNCPPPNVQSPSDPQLLWRSSSSTVSKQTKTASISQESRAPSNYGAAAPAAASPYYADHSPSPASTRLGSPRTAFAYAQSPFNRAQLPTGPRSTDIYSRHNRPPTPYQQPPAQP